MSNLSQKEKEHRANVFLCFASEDQEFVRVLDMALIRNRRRSALNNARGSSSTDSKLQLAMIDDADTFLFVISPDSIATPGCLDQLNYAVQKAKLIVAIMCREVRREDLPTSLAALNLIRFSEGSDFNSAFQLLLRDIPTDIKVDVFLCYSRADKSFVDSLYERLENVERSSWVDLKSIPFAELWEHEIKQGIEAADNFVFIISPDSIKSEYCLKELRHAVDHGKRIIPLLLRSVPSGTVPSPLKDLHWIDFQSGLAAFESLITTLETNQEDKRLHSRLLTRALEWDRKTQDVSFLLRGTDLQEAERWLVHQRETIEAKPTQIQTRYIIKSREAETGRQQAEISRQRKTRIGVTVGLVVAVILAAVAIVAGVKAENRRKEAETERKEAEAQRKEADTQRKLAEQKTIEADEQAKEAQRQAKEARRQQAIAQQKALEEQQQRKEKERQRQVAEQRRIEAETQRKIAEQRRVEADIQRKNAVEQRDLAHSRELAANANLRLADNPRESLRLALEAALTKRTAEAEDALRTALLESHLQVLIKRPILDGDYEDTNDPDERAGPVTFSSDGALVLTIDAKKAHLWETFTGKRLKEIPGQKMGVLSPDGKWAATVDKKDSQARVWNTKTWRQVASFKDKDGFIEGVVFSPDSEWLITSARSKDRITDLPARVWKVGTWKNVASPPTRDYYFEQERFSSDSKYLVSIPTEGIAQIWDTQTWHSVAELYGKGIPRIFFSPHSRYLALGFDDGVSVYDVFSWKPTATLREDDPIGRYYVEFSSDDTLIATTTTKGKAHIWKTATGKSVRVLQENSGQTAWLNFSRNGKYVALTAAGQLKSRVWEVANWHEMPLLGEPDQKLQVIDFSPDDSLMLTAELSTYSLREMPSGRSVMTLRGPELAGAHFTPDGKHLLCKHDENVSVWDANPAATVIQLGGHTNAVVGTQYSPDGKYILTGGTDKRVRLWESATGRLVKEAGTDEGTFSFATFSPDGRLLATIKLDGSLCTWEVGTWKLSTTFTFIPEVMRFGFSPAGKYLSLESRDRLQLCDVKGGPCRTVVYRRGYELGISVFSPQDRYVVTVSYNPTKNTEWGQHMDAEVWAAATGAHVATMKDHIAGIKDIECSPDEERAVSIGQNGVVHIWQLSTGVTLRKFGESYHDAFLVRFTTKGTRVLTLHSGPVNTDNGIRMWDAETAKLLWEADQGDQQIYSSGISKDGHYILTTSWDKTVTVVDTTTGHTTTLKGLTGPVYYATFSPDAKYVAGIGQDRTARVWNAASGETIAELRGSNVKLHSAEFSPDGKFIVTTSDDSVARIYPMKQFAPYDELLNMARQQYPEVQPSSDKPRNTKQD